MESKQIGESEMFAITGITGKVGGYTAKSLVGSGHRVRAVLRDPAKGANWVDLGCTLAQATMTDSEALSRAFSGVEGVFLVIPPIFSPGPGFPEIREILAALMTALQEARPPKIVCLSTIGAQATQPNLLNQLGIVEEELAKLPIPITFLRAAWFMENSVWEVESARTSGKIPFFLQPLDKAVPMVATVDIGTLAAELLLDSWEGVRLVELEGPRRVSPYDIASTFQQLLGRPVTGEMPPRETWEDIFRAQGADYPRPRAQMLDGFNEGWIEFESTPLKGTTDLEAVLAELCAAS